MEKAKGRSNKREAKWVWVREIFRRRTEYGEFHNLVRECRLCFSVFFFKKKEQFPSMSLLLCFAPDYTLVSCAYACVVRVNKPGLTNANTLFLNENDDGAKTK